ncbi:MAG: hypothetical protein ABI068_05010 [Ktedonobacterales bacterium]
MRAVYFRVYVAYLRSLAAMRTTFGATLAIKPSLKRSAALVAALSVLSVALVGCQVAGTTPGSTTGSSQTLISTPNPALQTPTPQFPPFTVGAWASNFSPNANDTITIYVLCRVQPSDMSQPATPPPPLGVIIQPTAPIGGTYTGTTDAHGLAAVPITFNDPSPGTPITVAVSVTYNGRAYHTTTFFTPSPTAASPTPNASPSASPGASPTAGG